MKFSAIKWLCISAASMMIAVSCTKPEEVDLEPPVNADPSTSELFTDTFLAEGLLVLRNDPVRSDEFSKDFLGTYHDQVFGTTKSTVALEFQLPEDPPNIWDVSDFDRITLNLDIQNFYGEATTQQTFEVYELGENINVADTYYSDESIQLSSQKIGEWTGTINPEGEVLQIELSQEFENKVLNATEAQLSNVESFRQLFKGMAVVPVDQFTGSRMGAIFYISQDTSSISLHSGAQVYNWEVSGESARVSLFSHSYTGSRVGSILEGLIFPSRIYAQPMAGIKTNLDFPRIRELSEMDEKIVIHQAKLILTPDESFYPYDPPVVVSLSASDSAFKNIPVRDLVSERNVGGTYDESSNSYTFDITLHTQYLVKLLEDNTIGTFGFNISVPTDNPAKANPVVFTNKPGESGVQLVLSYTKLAK